MISCRAGRSTRRRCRSLRVSGCTRSWLRSAHTWRRSLATLAPRPWSAGVLHPCPVTAGSSTHGWSTLCRSRRSARRRTSAQSCCPTRPKVLSGWPRSTQTTCTASLQMRWALARPSRPSRCCSTCRSERATWGRTSSSLPSPRSPTGRRSSGASPPATPSTYSRATRRSGRPSWTPCDLTSSRAVPPSASQTTSRFTEMSG
mmetsp:Transcript_58375/g.173726  ORF Transcript_58375/g.173726 Transcript_58375/m.173726 type:complete len:202 (-) Transcript_58375:1086-1691(-)